MSNEPDALAGVGLAQLSTAVLTSLSPQAGDNTRLIPGVSQCRAVLLTTPRPAYSVYRAFFLALLGMLSLNGCAVVAVAGAAVSVVSTAVSVTATVVETTVDVAAAGVDAVVGADENEDEDEE